MGPPMRRISSDDLRGEGQDRHPLVETAPPDRPAEKRSPGGARLDQHPGHRWSPHGEGEAERSTAASQIDR